MNSEIIIDLVDEFIPLIALSILDFSFFCINTKGERKYSPIFMDQSCWHVSTYGDWNETMDYLGGAYEAGVKIKQSLN
jgi:hypothetical protein